MISKLDVDIINSMTLLELDVLRYIDLNKKEVIGYSIQELSKKSFVSTATIMRFCKKLGKLLFPYRAHRQTSPELLRMLL